MNIAHPLRAFIRDNFYAAQKLSIGDDDSLLDRGIIDSTGVLELVAYLEEHFHIQVRDEEIVPETLDTISNAIRFVQSKLA